MKDQKNGKNGKKGTNFFYFFTNFKTILEISNFYKKNNIYRKSFKKVKKKRFFFTCEGENLIKN